MTRNVKYITTSVLAAAIIMGTVGAPFSSAAKVIKLNKKTIYLNVGESTVIKLQNGKKKGKVTWKTSKKSVVKIIKKSVVGNKAQASLKAVKKGSATITASYKLGSITKKVKSTIKVSNKVVTPTVAPSESAAPVVTPTPVVATQAPTQAPTVEPTQEPTATPAPTAKVISPDDASILESIPSDYSASKDGVTYDFKTVKYYSGITDSNREADVILPANYDESKKYPVLYMLHGIGGGDGRYGKGNDCSLARMTANAIAAGTAEEMIVVAPNTRVTTLGETWDQSYASDSVLYVHSFENYAYYDMFREDLIQYLMPYMEENYSIKTGRENTAVAGFSMGGRESLYIGVSKPELFGYIGAFCPAFGIFEYINADVGAREPGLFTEETFTLPESLKYNTYIQIVKGISDGVVKDQPTIHHNVLEDNGVPHIYYEKSGGHDEGVWGHGYYNFISNAFK